MLLRMLGNINKWDSSRHPINRPNPTIWGDAVTDLKTQQETLSTWLANNEEEINIGLVALALGRDKVDKISYVFIDESELASLEIQVSDKELGKAKGLDQELLKKHRDLIDMDYSHLGMLAEYMHGLTLNASRCKTIAKDKLTKLLERYKKENKIRVQDMNEKLRDNLNW